MIKSIKRFLNRIGGAAKNAWNFVAPLIPLAVGNSLITYPTFRYFEMIIIDPKINPFAPMLAMQAILLSITSVTYSWCNSIQATEDKERKDKIRRIACLLLLSCLAYFVCLIFTFLFRNLEIIVPKKALIYNIVNDSIAVFTQILFGVTVFFFVNVLFYAVKLLISSSREPMEVFVLESKPITETESVR